MTIGAKILAGAAILCILFWFGLMALGVQPLVRHSRAQVIYGESEEFFSDAVAYGKLRNDGFLLVRLPHARSACRWLSVDFVNSTIAVTHPPRSIGSFKYLLNTDELGSPIVNQGPAGGWFLQFTDQGAAASGEGFTFTVRRKAR